MDQIWSDSYLAQLSTDAIDQIATDLACIWVRECIQITRGVSTYTLPTYVRSVSRITWRGRSLDAVSWEEMTMLTPATIFVGPNSPANVETSVSRPLYYTMHPTNPWDIRLYPCPDESFALNGEPDPYSPQFNSPACIISHWRRADPNGDPVVSLPSYIQRRTQKAFVMWKAFGAEGKGQNLNASSYYRTKYEFLIDQFRAINEGCYIGKKYSIDDGMLTVGGFKYPKPFLPANFERVVY